MKIKKNEAQITSVDEINKIDEDVECSSIFIDNDLDHQH